MYRLATPQNFLHHSFRNHLPMKVEQTQCSVYAGEQPKRLHTTFVVVAIMLIYFHLLMSNFINIIEEECNQKLQ
jgi:hypothetical protein